MTTLSASGLSVEQDGRAIFDGVGFEIGSGERLAVLGPSGSGKTTLLAVLAGLTEPSAGSVQVDGRTVTAEDRRSFALVLQGYGLVSLLTAGENVEAALRASGWRPRDCIEPAAQALADVGLAGFETHLVEELSGGQQQRVAVARALALRPDVLLADEPTAEQDPASRALVLTRMLEVTERGGILVLATHDPDVAALCTKSVRIGRGHAAEARISGARVSRAQPGPGRHARAE